MKFPLFFRQKKPEPLLALDIGTEIIKAAVFHFEEEETVITGYGKAKQNPGDFKAGMIINSEGVTESTEKALEEAFLQANEQPKKTILGIGGNLVKGIATTVRINRESSKLKIGPSELKYTIRKVQEKAIEEAKKQIEKEDWCRKEEAQLLNASINRIFLDSQETPELLERTGKEIEIEIFNIFSSSTKLEILERLAANLDLNLLTVCAEPFVVAQNCKLENQEDFSGILLDIGGETTDLTVVYKGGVVGSKMFNLGGKNITESISSEMGLSLEKAEEKKIKYSLSDLEPTLVQKIREAINFSLELFSVSVESILKEFKEVEFFPPNFYLYGGGALLPDIKTALISYPWLKVLPFSHFPKVNFLEPDNIPVLDQTGKLKTCQDIVPAALAAFGLDLSLEETYAAGNILQEVVRTLKV